MTARRSLLAPSRAEIAAEIGRLLGRDRAQAIRYGARFDPRPHYRQTVEIPESAWHPATQLSRPHHGGDDKRGNAEDRRRRKLYLLNTYGDGNTAPCAFCRAPLTFDSVTVDRFPIPGHKGGRYTRDNIRPACGSCNSEDGGRQGNEIKRGMQA